jgi:HK97 family phage major capsid protein
MNRDEIVRAMSAITETGEVLSDEQVAEYERLEGELQRANKSDEIIARQAAWKSVSVPKVLMGQADESDAEISRSFDQYLRTGKADASIQRAQSEGTGGGRGPVVRHQVPGRLQVRQ